MANVMKISGPASALLLLAALLAAGARADRVTTAECAARRGRGRVRQYPVDTNAITLDLDQCNLTGIQERTLTGLPEVTALWLSHNELRELPALDEHVCANLTVLSLSSNQLTEINSGTFFACTKLQELYLSKNQIEFIHHTVFTALTNLKLLFLDNNKIMHIPYQLFANNDKLKMLFLNNNRLTRLPPDFATSLKRTGAELELFHFNDNPWHCVCLVELLADVKRADVRYYFNVGFYEGARLVCVFSGAAPCRPQPGPLRPARGGR